MLSGCVGGLSAFNVVQDAVLCSDESQAAADADGGRVGGAHAHGGQRGGSVRLDAAAVDAPLPGLIEH